MTGTSRPASAADSSTGPVIGLCIAVIVFSALYASLVWNLTFYQDTWEFLVNRRGFSADSLLKPHNEHIVLIPVLLQQLQLWLFGMGSAAPEYVLQGMFLILAAVALFLYVRRRCGGWLALGSAVLLLFLGPAWETILWPFEICFVGSMLCGMAMLLALEREDSRGDASACMFLVLSLGFNSLGVAFLVAAVVALVQDREGWLRRSYVVAVPALLFGAWYVGWGHAAGNEVTLRHALEAPRYVLESVGAALEAVLGLSTSRPGEPAPFEWGRTLVVAGIALLVVGQRPRPRFSARLWPVAAAAATYWVLAALNHSAAREPTTSRYLYAGVALLLLSCANLFEGGRGSGRGLVVSGVVVLAAVGANVVLLHDGAAYLKAQAVLTRADLGAMQIARRTIDPHFVPAGDAAGTGALVNVEAGKYFPAVDAHGSPAYTAEEISRSPSPGPRYADLVLSEALPITAVPVLGRCEAPTIDGAASEIALTSERTRISLSAGPAVKLALRRFAMGEFPVVLGDLEGGGTVEIVIPKDRASRPWYLRAESRHRLKVCRAPLN